MYTALFTIIALLGSYSPRAYLPPTVPRGYPSISHDAPDGTYCNNVGCITIGGTTHDGRNCNRPYYCVEPFRP